MPQLLNAAQQKFFLEHILKCLRCQIGPYTQHQLHVQQENPISIFKKWSPQFLTRTLRSVHRKLFCLSLLTCYLNTELSFNKQGKSTLQLKFCHSGLRLLLIPDGWSTTDAVADICCQQQVTFPAYVKFKIYHRWSRKNVRAGDLKESI